VGTENDKPPVELDRAVTFAPSGDVAITALASLRVGGIDGIVFDSRERFVDRIERKDRNLCRGDPVDAANWVHGIGSLSAVNRGIEPTRS
jgi:propanol-preferring alcohol dehydrogenase